MSELGSSVKPLAGAILIIFSLGLITWLTVNDEWSKFGGYAVWMGIILLIVILSGLSKLDD